MPLGREDAQSITDRLRTALFRESLALVEAGIATTEDIDLVVETTLGRRLAIGGPFEIWEQIGWDLVSVIAGELLKDIASDTDISTEIELVFNRPGTRGTALALESGVSIDSIKKVAVIGAGLMGHGIALELAASGHVVRLQDLSAKLLSDAMIRIEVGLRTLWKAGRISQPEIGESLHRISVTTDIADCVADADLVLEAASEKRFLKKKIFEKLDTLAPSHAILASNTSTFLPSFYASSTNRPEQVLGIHYYNPPHLLPGVEIIRGPRTSDQVIKAVTAFYQAMGKRPAIVRREIQGFIGNRLQVAIIREAMSVVESKIATVIEVDQLVVKGLGRELAKHGPFKLSRSAGLGPTLALLGKTLPKLCNERSLPSLLRQKVEAGDLGVKTGKGFYEWTTDSAEVWREKMSASLLVMATPDSELAAAPPRSL